AIMSHELRTPLNAVLGYSELMELGISGPITDKMREQIGRIRISATHLLSLVNDILDLAKVEAGRLQVSSGPASATATVGAAAARGKWARPHHQSSIGSTYGRRPYREE